jgi:small subunit ribosomal protein S4
MARYTRSKTKLSRRIGKNLFLKGARSFSAKDDFSKKPYFPGEHGRKFKRLSEYGKQLAEKQTIRFTYGLMEKQLANLFKRAFAQDADTGKIVLGFLERRLDNVIYRAGLANSRSQARQLVNHGHFTVNGRKVNIPSYLVHEGDQIEIKENKKNKAFWKNFQLEVPRESPSWLDTGKDKKIKVINLPIDEDFPKDFNVNAVVEYYSRKVG